MVRAQDVWSALVNTPVNGNQQQQQQPTLDSPVSNAKNKKNFHAFFLPLLHGLVCLLALLLSLMLCVQNFIYFIAFFPLRKTHIITSRFSRRVVGLHSCIYVCLAIYKRWRNKTKKAKRNEIVAIRKRSELQCRWQQQRQRGGKHFTTDTKYMCVCTMQTIRTDEKNMYKNWRIFRFYFAFVLCRVDAPFVRLCSSLSVRNFPPLKLHHRCGMEMRSYREKLLHAFSLLPFRRHSCVVFIDDGRRVAA